ncbi:hypothetical protein J6590_047415 [Homalodisca vitripennis]|nr:hypothetical protein J6590_047415 [Homalodisca vitripennis]
MCTRKARQTRSINKLAETLEYTSAAVHTWSGINESRLFFALHVFLIVFPGRLAAPSHLHYIKQLLTSILFTAYGISRALVDNSKPSRTGKFSGLQIILNTYSRTVTLSSQSRIPGKTIILNTYSNCHVVVSVQDSKENSKLRLIMSVKPRQTGKCSGLQIILNTYSRTVTSSIRIIFNTYSNCHVIVSVQDSKENSKLRLIRVSADHPKYLLTNSHVIVSVQDSRENSKLRLIRCKKSSRTDKYSGLQITLNTYSRTVTLSSQSKIPKKTSSRTDKYSGLQIILNTYSNCHVIVSVQDQETIILNTYSNCHVVVSVQDSKENSKLRLIMSVKPRQTGKCSGLQIILNTYSRTVTSSIRIIFNTYSNCHVIVSVQDSKENSKLRLIRVSADNNNRIEMEIRCEATQTGTQTKITYRYDKIYNHGLRCYDTLIGSAYYPTPTGVCPLPSYCVCYHSCAERVAITPTPRPSPGPDTSTAYQSHDSGQVCDKPAISPVEGGTLSVQPARAATDSRTTGTENDLHDHPRGAITSFRRKLEFWNREEKPKLELRHHEDLEGARLIINGTKVDLRKQERPDTLRVTSSVNRTNISPSSPVVKTHDDNNNNFRRYKQRAKKDGYADFVKRQSLDRCIYSDDEIDYSVDIGRAAASQLLSSDSEESVDESLVDNLKKELSQFSQKIVKDEPSQADARHSIRDSNRSKTAPILENQNEPKKKVGGIRRLLSPGLFSGEHRRKSLDQGSSRTSTPVHDHSENKPKTILETAFVGGERRQSGRSKSVSPSRTHELKSPSGYGVPKTNAIRAKENGTKYYYDNGGPPNVNTDRNRNIPGEQKPTNYGPLQVDTTGRRDSVASSTSSSSTLVSPQDVTPPWVRDVNRNVNHLYTKTLSLPGYRNPPQASPHYRSQIPVHQSGRVSAPPYIDCCSPYGQINQDRLLMPVAAQLKITPGSTKQQVQQKPSHVSQQLRGLLSPQGLRPRGNDPFYYNHNHSSSVESSPGSQNSPKEVRNFNPNVPNLVKPQPIYNSSPQRRPRSVSPATGRPNNLPPEYFIRGSNQRNTYSGGRSGRQSTIYEEVIAEEGKEQKQRDDEGNPPYGPIFKRGTLLSSTCSEGDLNTSAGKRVSFSPSQEQDLSSGEIYWPTRKGMAPEPPTRQSTRGDQTDYVNVTELRGTPQAPDRPLPPIPRRTTQKTSPEYGVVGRHRGVANTPTSQRVQALASRWYHQQQQQADNRAVSSPMSQKVQPLPNRWHQQSDTESGSEAGEVIVRGCEGRRWKYKIYRCTSLRGGGLWR